MALMLLLCREVEASVTGSGTVPVEATAIDDADTVPAGLQLCITNCVASIDGALVAAAAAGDVESTTEPLPPGAAIAADPEFARAAAATAKDEAAARDVAAVAPPPPAAPPAAVEVAVVPDGPMDIEPSSKSKISDVDSECKGFFIDSPILEERYYYWRERRYTRDVRKQ